MNNQSVLDPQLDSAQASMMQGLGELAAYLGFNRTVGHIYGALMLCDHPLTLDELAQRTGKSKASVCQQTQVLVKLGTVRCVDGPVADQGTRRVYFGIEPSLERAAQTVAQRKLDELDQIDGVIGANFRTLQRLRNDAPEPNETIERLISRLDTFYSLLHLMTGFVTAVTETVLEEPASVTDNN